MSSLHLRSDMGVISRGLLLAFMPKNEESKPTNLDVHGYGYVVRHKRDEA